VADMDGSGSIALAELLTHIDLERTAFTVKIFSIFDDDKSGEIDFKEFVMSLWNYCTLTKSTLGKWRYRLCLDVDSISIACSFDVWTLLWILCLVDTPSASIPAQICSPSTCTTRTPAASCPAAR
jgi:hypothetical protein